MLLLESLSPWARPRRLAELVELLSGIGFEELVVFWPWNDDDRRVFEREATQITSLAG